ncbi:MAG: hypothetical protein IPK53_08585 [bacterium]|nr:hypothetical protein [bacterium]
MPPFPPGITRSDEQREQATSGRMEALAMQGLGYYARGRRSCCQRPCAAANRILCLFSLQREP